MESEREAARRAIKRRNWLVHLWREWIVESRRPIAPVFARPTPDTWSNENLTAAWIGHSTVLINFFGVTILTDPFCFHASEFACHFSLLARNGSPNQH